MNAEDFPHVTFDQAFQLEKTRRANLAHTLSISIAISSTSVSHTTGPGNQYKSYAEITGVITLTNISTETVVIWRPTFVGVGLAGYDIQLHFDPRAEQRFEYYPTSFDRFARPSATDFIALIPGQLWVVYFNEPIGYILNPTTREADNLPAGPYRLSAVYQNRLIGYYLDQHVFSPSLDLGTGHASVFSRRTQLVDLGALVGDVESAQVEFQMPDINQP